MKYAKGVCWVDDTRIPYIDEIPNIGGRANHGRGGGYGFIPMLEQIEPNTQGRFTPNLLVCDDMLNDGSVSKSNQKKKIIEKKHNYNVNFGVGENYNDLNDSGSSSRYYDLDKWFDKMIDEIR